MITTVCLLYSPIIEEYSLDSDALLLDRRTGMAGCTARTNGSLAHCGCGADGARRVGRGGRMHGARTRDGCVGGVLVDLGNTCLAQLL
jgi:hypothetical protein